MTNYRWFDFLGEFESIENGRVYLGSEYDLPIIPRDTGSSQSESSDVPVTTTHPEKGVHVGQSICNQMFKEGVIKVEIEFEAADDRCMADIILQYDPRTEDMLNFSLGGAAREAKWANFYSLRLWAAQPAAVETNPPAGGTETAKSWKALKWGGHRASFKAGRSYQLELIVKGSSLSVVLDGVNMARHTLPFAFPGLQVGIFCAAPKKVFFRNFSVECERPQAFVIMQFNTPEYESLFRDVITPVCEKSGLRVYRGDFTKHPGIVISDITKNLTESAVVIAEITPVNGNVYYEVGYADALKKPVILIADQNVGQLPFDVRANRTIFYENTIGGKKLVEQTLSEYLKSVLAPQSF